MNNKLLILPSLVVGILLLPSLTRAQDSDRMCTMQYDPVCGVKAGVYATYGNGCVLGAEGATYIHDGECSAAELGAKPSTGTYVPPASCTAWFDGCNVCSKQPGGQVMCSLRACTADPAPGYCTAYAATPKPAPAPIVSVPPVETSVDAEIAATATTTEHAAPGFFARIWIGIVAWFSELF